ncbi:hypothetical protein CLAFUW4_08105 [Fulvia fulva]|uniref:Fatty acid desaturase domain-containing protein n=1 Tax=Passalora fulva TaxID=5499 RepID=A0A9Q8LD32_PASFU|nr:uncharacterized protein CLAFUR5_08222 [Fulvia fulva]KAK4629510.1 hypothetical protein CLAFUR4_08110 [Fulvia fulva]KAK4630758.1 hypothetical protein CLAFUR0_08105 [Fulvia fulva]UJO15232.1 hypothetical protein CLAFUR5_08222 [Fulvia fulva]WPV12165.1 hypothetical protein CLAFUW4_08105 [Fulvia fulva]WPV27877.1 hypothetical protein CLAFUW7_08105 [Fulvia fulva]
MGIKPPEGEGLLPPNPYLTHADHIVLDSLYKDIRQGTKNSKQGQNHDQAALDHLRALNNPSHPKFEPTVLSMYDRKDIPPWINRFILDPYGRVATKIVRHPTDVVFLTHILWNTLIALPSAVYLFYNFTYVHAVAHAVHAVWCAGPFTLMMHNHIHNHGILAKSWKMFDSTFPYVLEPLLGHTWDTYYYHHVKHHHVEANGPEDLSSTIRYQRDELLHFMHYEGRFLFLVWYDLPQYFIKKNQPLLALKTFASEISSYIFLYSMARLSGKASIFVFFIPLFFMRLALMIGNWGQHALVDEVEPDHDLRSSITLIDVPSNRFCFNDGYHTSHHLHPLRHWREQPIHFMQQKELYANERALVFHDIDFFMMTIRLLCKDYATLADHLVPMGDQANMTKAEIAAMLKSKTRRFTEEEIRQKFRKKGLSSQAQVVKDEL